MTTSTMAPPGPTPTGGPDPAGPVAAADSALDRAEPGRWSPATTPGWYRAATAVCLVVTVAFGITATVAGAVVRGSSRTVETGTGPTLIAVQELFAGVAEADAAATAVHLSGSTGDEDRARRNLYLEALARSADQVEEVAALVGPSERAHDALGSIAVDLTTYSGRVEAARAANRGDGPGDGDEALRSALAISQNDIPDAVATVTDVGRRRFDTERDSGRILQQLAVVIGLAAVAALAWLQVGAYRRSNRLLNLPLLAATALVLGAVMFLSVRAGARASALDNASTGGYDAIAATASGQSATFALQSELSLRLLGGDDGGDVADVDGLLAAIDGSVAELADGADSPREEAAAAELAERWQRYRSAAEQILDLAGDGDTDEAVGLFQGEGLATFNGMNTSLESVLSDNQSQFADGIAGAADAVGLLPAVTAAAAALAAGALLAGVQQRLGDYR